jgi:pimeloyl-ACP methyl ester carboxylesterase
MSTDFSGAWRGVFDSGATKVTLDFDLAAMGGRWTAVLHSRVRRADVLMAIEVAGERMRLVVADADLTFDLAAQPDGATLAGQCRHAGVVYPMRCVRGDAPPAPAGRRSQTPTAPFGYEVDAVAFVGADGTRREGTLTRPANANGAAVVLSAWFGQTDRDQITAGHRPMAIWADELTRRGLITLRYDKRGAGASGGDFERTTTGDLAADLERAVAFLRQVPGVHPGRIGLMGHSEGGHIGADVAAADPAIAFCVLLTPTGVAEAKTFETELFRAAEAVGARVLEGEREPRVELQRALDAAGRNAPTAAQAVQQWRALLSAAAAEGAFPPAHVEPHAQAAGSPWRRFWWRYDTTASLRRLTCPTLALFAGQDLQTSPAWHGPPIRAALADNPDATIVELPGLNHFLQTARTGAPSEYRDIEETLSPKAIETVCSWLQRAVGRIDG